VDALGGYRWSSYPYYGGNQKAPGWMTTGTMLEELGAQHATFEAGSLFTALTKLGHFFFR
jgi:hypothetical protein